MLADTLKSINHRGSPKEARHFERKLAKMGAETLQAKEIRDKPATKHVRAVDDTREMPAKWLMIRNRFTSPRSRRGDSESPRCSCSTSTTSGLRHSR